jgi:hypothetical protein
MEIMWAAGISQLAMFEDSGGYKSIRISANLILHLKKEN